MAAEQPSRPTPSLVAAADQPLIGIVLVENGREVTRYFIDEADADAAVADQNARDVRTLVGSWADLSWPETIG